MASQDHPEGWVITITNWCTSLYHLLIQFVPHTHSLLVRTTCLCGMSSWVTLKVALCSPKTWRPMLKDSREGYTPTACMQFMCSSTACHCVLLPLWLQPVIEMEMKFPKDYPMNPPFVRIVRPRFRFLTGGSHPPPNPCLVKIMILVVSPSYHTILSLTYRSCDHWRQYLYADVDQIRLVSIQWHRGMSSHIHVQVCSSVLICCPHTHTEHPDPSAGRDHVWLQCSTGHKSWAALRWTRSKGCLWENGQTLWMGEIAPLRVHLAELACVLDSPSNLLLHCLK